MNHSELKRKQDIQVSILKDFHQFCSTYGLEYFMFYGTLLGAVRHQGFIPWDLDVDTAMTRAEYAKFKKLQKNLPKHLIAWEGCYSDVDHVGLGRLIVHDKDLGNVYIDIFILDYEREMAAGSAIARNLCQLLHFAKLSNEEKSILIKHFENQPLKRGIIQFSKIITWLVGGNAAAEKLISKLRVSKVPTSHYITLEDDKLHFPVEYFAQSKLLPFDGSMCSAPVNPHELLTIMYGNYMEIPPEGLRWMEEEKQQKAKS